jgi:hypothetical protein
MRLRSVTRWSARCTAGLLLAALVVAPAAAGPPQAGNRNLDDLLPGWFTWALGGHHPDHMGNVQFLPLPNAQPVDDGAGTADDPATFRGEINVTLKKKQSFVLPLIGWTREVYQDGTTDPFLPDSAFADARVVQKIDGRTVLDSSRDDLEDFYVDPTDLKHPVIYPEPTPYGTVGTVGFQAIGVVIGPLPVGEHTMTLESELRATVADPNHPVNTGAIYQNTWHITVQK